jgi:hypothetical protein
LSAPNLYYAYKQGIHVSVVRQNVITGDEQDVLQYEEPRAAQHDDNAWDESLPSIALDSRGERLIYAGDLDVILYDLKTGVSTTLLKSAPGDTGQASVGSWVTPTGKTLCCAYQLANLSVGPDGRAIAQMAQYEGLTLASFASDGTDACEVDSDEGAFFQAGDISWNERGDAVWGVPQGEGIGGLFVTSADQPCRAEELAHDLTANSSGFDGAVWSPDGQSIAVVQRTGDYLRSDEPLILVSSDVSTHRTLVADGPNYSPLFSPGDSDLVYYAHIDAVTADGTVAKSSVWTVDATSKSTRKLLSLPDGWSVAPSGWTSEGYLMLQMTYGCVFYKGCGSRLAVVDPGNGDLIYLSATRDFTNFLGFVP